MFARKNSVEPIAIRQQNNIGYIKGSKKKFFIFFSYVMIPLTSVDAESMDNSSSKFIIEESSTYHDLGDPRMEFCGLCITTAAPVNKGDVSKLLNSSVCVFSYSSSKWST
ncbi:unnamed protein product [Ambrosiozyma monospora]|uniref:Unnamed protein product n=1 Tax=Ambrosiozyma monospora TaxID=43982 RepID=A0A9W7DK95_AMBMO|nr:unnamed protein product [Ambrosiozyma monospora]